jgi:hypothetical protein
MHFLTVIVMFLVSIPVAFVLAWAFALWAAVPLVTRGLRQLMGRGRHAMSDGGPWPTGRKAGWLGVGCMCHQSPKTRSGISLATWVTGDLAYAYSFCHQDSLTVTRPQDHHPDGRRVTPQRANVD